LARAVLSAIAIFCARGFFSPFIAHILLLIDLRALAEYFAIASTHSPRTDRGPRDPRGTALGEAHDFQIIPNPAGACLPGHP